MMVLVVKGTLEPSKRRGEPNSRKNDTEPERCPLFKTTVVYREPLLTQLQGLQVHKCLLWALKYVNMTYFGPFGAPGLGSM